MPRYIDADALAVKWMLANTQERETFRQIIDEEPTADVVPKSEVEMWQGALKAEELHNELTMEMAKKALTNAKAEIAREIFEELERKLLFVGQASYSLAEIKKKYTEGASE